MKKLGLLILIVLFIGTIRGFSQRCLSGQWGVELSGGWGDGYPLIKNRSMDYSLGLSFFRYAQNQNKWMIGIEYMEKHFCYKCNTVPVSQFLMPVGYWYNLFTNRIKSIFFNLTGGLLLGYESINWGQKNFCDGAILKNRNCFWDVNNGISRRSWARNEGAVFAIKRAMEANPNLKVTLPNFADDQLIESLF